MASGYIYAGTMTGNPAATTADSALGVCEVHRLLDNDSRTRLVRWCDFCKAWICDECRESPIRRGRAALKRARG